MRPEELAARVTAVLPETVVVRDEVVAVVPREELVAALERLRADPELAFDLLSQVTATDWPGREPRFWLSYDLYSTTRRHRLRVKVGLPEDDPRAPSVVGVYPTADWHERETYDLFGIVFEGHPDLRRILLPEDWEGHPLRKDEEMGGVPTRFHGALVPPVDRRGR
ncbi:MAG: hypothetical protein KatS3mg014_2090 [Actinomycetota bacterium]|nr:MAG: hypothetical protein KatS3mg014_2090 [Actinomycetota bacterium]